MRYAPAVQFPLLPFVVLDTETTGFLPRVDRVIEFASIRVEDGTIADTHEQLFSIPAEIPPHVQVLTRIKPRDLSGKPALADRKREIESYLPSDCILVGQNLAFDIAMLKGEGVDLSDRPWIDTSLLASLVFPELKSYSLHYLSRVLGLNHEPAHRAMGDVRATLELLARIWERLLELPDDLAAVAKHAMLRSTPGYRTLFNVLEPRGSTVPGWIQRPTAEQRKRSTNTVALTQPPPGTVALHEESLHPDSLQVLLDSAEKDPALHWIAVKNLENALRKTRVPESVQVLYPPILLLDPDAADRLQEQESLMPEEATLVTKIAWFRPVLRSDIAIHGGERDVWNGKLACTERSSTYERQFETRAETFIIDHRQLLSFLVDPKHAAHGALTDRSHIIIDDASMLEDTATKAYGHSCALDDLRAAAQGYSQLTKLVDLAMLWAEKTRGMEDTHHVTASDLTRPETKAMVEQISTFLEDTAVLDLARHLLKELRALLDRQHLTEEVRWIETRPSGSIHLHGAPERVDALLQASLYERFPTTLVVPEGSGGLLPEVLPPKVPTVQADPLPLPPCIVPVTFRDDATLADILRAPPAGRTVVLTGSKRVIEQYFIAHTEPLEEQGITLVCQGLSGGQGRMEADFLAAQQPVLWLLTPWMYEGIELPEGGVDHLILETVPFDHPGYPVFARRKGRYRNPFEEYCLPRVEHRLFRLLRTFCRHRTEGGDVTILDARLRDRNYGPRIRHYIESTVGVPTTPATERSEKPKGSKLPSGQPSLFEQ